MFRIFSRTILKPISLFMLTVFLTLSLAPLAYALSEDTTNSDQIKMVMLLGTNSAQPDIIAAYKKLESYSIKLSIFTNNDFGNENRLDALKQSVSAADIFIIEMISGTSSQATVDQILLNCPDDCKVISTRSSLTNSRIDGSRDKEFAKYFEHGGIENMRRLLLLLGKYYASLATPEDTSPIPTPGRFIYHPDAVGLTVNVDGIYEDMVDELNKSTTDTYQGLNVNCAYQAAHNNILEISESTGSVETEIPTRLDLVRAAISQAVKDSPDSTSAESTPTPSASEIHKTYETVAEIASHISENDNSFEELNDKVYQLVLDKSAIKTNTENSTDSANTLDTADESNAIPSSLLVDTIYDAIIDKSPKQLLKSILPGIARSIYEGFGIPEESISTGLPVGLLSFYNKMADSVSLQTDGGGGFGYKPGTFGTLGGYMAWYEVSGHLNPNSPWIGISTSDSAYKDDDMRMHVAIQDKLELKGVNALLVFSGTNYREEAFNKYFMPAGKRQVELLIAAQGFNFISGKQDLAIELFNRLDVPVISPVYSGNLDDWVKNPAGISSELHWQIAIPELEGRIEPIFMGGTTVVETDTSTGALITKKIPVADRIDRVVNRAVYWLNLRTKMNSEKKVAIVYYNHHGGKDDIGAAYLNTIESASDILEAMRADGYKVDGGISSSAIENIIRKKGRNIGSWAPGELDDMVKEGVLKIPLDKYLQWYEEIPEKLRNQVEKEWGPAPGNVMVHNGQLVIPGAQLGNIFIGPQPMRGWGDDPSKIAHSPSLPPPHQYIAFYFWLQKEYKADAVIHLGTHGTLEWLPGRSVGLGADDWPDVLIGDMPDIYPYIMNNPGEGTQAKRRGYAVTIDHLTPPMIKPQLYGDLAELQQLVNDYNTELSAGNSKRASAIWDQITAKIKETGIDSALELNNVESTETAERIEEYLQGLTTELMPYGLHTFGTPPPGDLLDQMTDSIIDYDKETRESSRSKIKENLLLTTNEIVNLLKALKGEYIEPGKGRDPVRVPGALPTGRNLVSFDPREAPDKAAWETGKKAADLLLTEYYEKTGHYPDTVGVVLWAIESMRTGGESVALILRLIGAEPVWDSSGRLKSVKITPLSELGRPRINVLVTISGLFRDTFSYTIGVLDDAFRQIAQLDETPENNYVRKDYLEVRKKLIDQGYSETDADNLAQARIFGEPPGTYGTGVSELVSSTSAWDNANDLVETYMNRMSYIYGKSQYGVPAKDVFKEMLKNVDAVVQVRDSLWGALDNDDVGQYLGGLRLAVEAASGESVSTYIVNTRSGDPKIQTFNEFVKTELLTRLLNPTWIEGMLKEGYAGSREIADHLANAFLADATLDGITDTDWQQIAETFIFDESIRKQIDPFALESIIAWNLEAARRNMWQTDDTTLRKLSDIYVESAADYGVVCCHHTCANLVFNEWVANYTTIDSAVLSKFKSIYEKATNKTLNIAVKTDNNANNNDSNNNSSNRDNNSNNSATNNTVQQNANNPTEVLGSKTTPQQKDESRNNNKSTNKSDRQSNEKRISQTADSKADSKSSGSIKSTTRKKKGNKTTNAGTSSDDYGASSKTQRLDETKLTKNTSGQAGKNSTNDIGDSANSVKGYEIEVDKSNSNNGGNGSKAVTALAILAGLGVVGIFAAGYLRYYRTQGE